VVVLDYPLIVPFVPLPVALLMPLTALRIQLKVETRAYGIIRKCSCTTTAAGVKELVKTGSD
jgi:hypothetical protein